MSIQYENIKRDGVSTLVKLAKALCRIVIALGSIIRGKYPDDGAVIILLNAIEALCPLIADAEIEADLLTGDNQPVLDDPSETPGINPGLPPAADPTA
jgi:hypothetical protein